MHNKTVNIAATERSDFSLGAFMSFRSAHLEVFLLENVVLIGLRLRRTSWKHITEKIHPFELGIDKVQVYTKTWLKLVENDK